MEIVSVIKARIIKEIGFGEGMNSTVYLAHDPQLGGNVAIKVMPINRFKDPSEYFKEAQFIYKTCSPRVVAINYASINDNAVHIQMPYYENGSVVSYLNKYGPVTLRQILIWTQQFSSGINHIHSKDIVHFDIKPSNIIINNDGSAMIADFGQAMPVDVYGVAKAPSMYWSHWPPEILRYNSATKQADIYQIGVTLYRLCNGEEFFETQRPKTHIDAKPLILSGKFPNRDKFLPHIPSRLRRIVVKLMNVDPHNRYHTVIDFQNELNKVGRLLDWKYYKTADNEIWKKENESHIFHINITKRHKLWHVDGYTERKDNGIKRNRNDWCSKRGFRTVKQAEKCVDKIFREMEKNEP